MKRIVGGVTERGQVTIPAEVRRLLELDGHRKVVFRMDGEEIRVAPQKWTVDTLAESFEPLRTPVDFDQWIREAMEEHADEIVRKMRAE